MKKTLILALVILGMGFAQAQDKLETIIYVDGVETKTVSYKVDDYSILDVFMDGRLMNSTREKDSITITGSLEIHKAYGQYIAFNISITNNSSKAFNFLPAQHLVAQNIDHKGKHFSALSYKEYQKIVKRRQNGNAFLKGLATGLSGYNAGTSYASTSGRIGGTSYSSTTVVYNPTLARLERDRNNADLANFVTAQTNSLLAAKDAYLKSNTIAPGQTIAGHILISTRKLSKKAINSQAVITLNGIEFLYKAKIIKGNIYH